MILRFLVNVCWWLPCFTPECSKGTLSDFTTARKAATPARAKGSFRGTMRAAQKKRVRYTVKTPSMFGIRRSKMKPLIDIHTYSCIFETSLMILAVIWNLYRASYGEYIQTTSLGKSKIFEHLNWREPFWGAKFAFEQWSVHLFGGSLEVAWGFDCLVNGELRVGWDALNPCILVAISRKGLYFLSAICMVWKTYTLQQANAKTWE